MLSEKLEYLQQQKNQRIEVYRKLALLNQEIQIIEAELVSVLQEVDTESKKRLNVCIRKKTTPTRISYKGLIESCQQFLRSFIGDNMSIEQTREIAKQQAAFIWKQPKRTSKYSIKFL